MPIRYADSLIEDERQLIIEERQKNPNVKPAHLKATVNHNRALAGLPPLSKTKSISNALASDRAKAKSLGKLISDQEKPSRATHENHESF